MWDFLNGNKWAIWPACKVPGNPLGLCIRKELCGQNKIFFLLLQPITAYFIERAVILCVLRPSIFLKKIWSNKPGLPASDMNQAGVLIWKGFCLVARTQENTTQRKKRFLCVTALSYCSSQQVCLQVISILQLYIVIWILQQMWQMS